VSKPPIPILEKSQSGLMMDWRTTFPLDFPLNCREEPSAFSKMTDALARLIPTWKLDHYVTQEYVIIEIQNGIAYSLYKPGISK